MLIRSMPDPELLNTYQVARMLGVNHQTVTRWRKRGKIPFTRLPGSEQKPGLVRFDRATIETWLAERDGKNVSRETIVEPDTEANRVLTHS